MIKLLERIHEMSIDIRKQRLESQIVQLQCDEKRDGTHEGGKIAVLKNHIEDLSMQAFRDVALGIDEEYDWETLATKTFDNRYTAKQLQKIWKFILHPSINKGPLTDIEYMHMQKHAQSNINQDWDRVAMELNTGRTGYLCQLLWTSYSQRLTPDRVEILRKTISKMDNKEKIKLYNKFAEILRCRKSYNQWKVLSGKVTKKQIRVLRQNISKLNNKTKIILYNKYTALLEVQKVYAHLRTVGPKLTKEQIDTLRRVVSKLITKARVQVYKRYPKLKPVIQNVAQV